MTQGFSKPNPFAALVRSPVDFGGRTLDYRILGTFEVCDDGIPLALGGPKQRAVLAALLLRRGRPVSLDRLIDDLWGDSPPATAAATLQAYISQLRRLLEPDRRPGAPTSVLDRGPGGYVLRADPDQIDAHRFEQLHDRAVAAMTAGEAAEAETAIVEALSLHRGDPLAEFATEEFARPEAVRLGEVVLAATETRFELRLRRGDAGVAADLAQVVDAHPYRERLRCQLMLALYRSGRQADALQVAEQGRRALVDELGLDPSPELVDLERRILSHDPGLRLLPAQPPQPSSGVGAAAEQGPTLVGRGAALTRIESALDQLGSAQGSLLLVTGEAGVGKTTLAEAAADRARARGYTTVWARCPDDQGQPALWPWAVAVRRLSALDPGLPDRHPEVLRLLQGAGHAEPSADHGDPDAARFRLFAAVAALLAEVAADKSVVLVIDDLQWADPASLRLVEFLAAEIADIPMLVIGTFRIDDLVGSALMDRLGHIYRHQRVGRIELGGLPATDIAAIAAGVWGRPVTGVEAEALASLTSGNPLFITEVLAWIDGDGERMNRLLGGEVPDGIGALVRARVARLGDDTRRLLGVGAVIGRQFDLGLVASVGGLGSDTLTVAEPALRARHLVDAGAGEYAFAHPLVQAAIYAELPAATRTALHLAVARILEKRDGVAPVVVAAHYRRALTAGGAEGAARHGAEAARAAMHRLAYEDAAAWWSHTLEALDHTENGSPEARHDALVNLAGALLAAGDHLGARRQVRRAITVAERLGDHAGVARAVAVLGRVVLWNFVGPVDIEASGDEFVAVTDQRPLDYDPTLIEPMDRALPHLDETDPATIAALGMFATELTYTPRQAEGLGHARRAVDLARRHGGVELRVQTLENLITCLFVPGTTEERLALGDEVLAVPRLAPDIEAVARMERMACLSRMGDLAGWRDELERCRRLADRDLGPVVGPQIGAHQATAAAIAGRWEEAEAVMDAAYLRMTTETTAWAPDLARLQQTYVIRFHQGRLGELAPGLRAMVAGAGPYIAAPAALAILDAGDRAEAEALAGYWTGSVRNDWAWDIFAFTWTELALRTGLPDPHQLLAEIMPHADDFATLGTSLVMFGSLHRMVGMLYLAADAPEVAADHLRTAAARNHNAGLLIDEAWSRLHLATALERIGDDPSQERSAARMLAETLHVDGILARL